MKNLSVVVLVVAALLSLPTFDPVAAQFDMAGELVSPIYDLPLRSDAPGTFFKAKGSAIGMAEAGGTYRVLEQRTVPTLWGSQNWLKVQAADKSTVEGWIYNGGSGTVNVSIKK